MSGTGADAHEIDRLARVALSQLCEPGDARMVTLVDQLGAPTVRDLLAAERDPGSGLVADVAARLSACDPVRDLARAAGAGIRFVIPGDAEWPVQVDRLMTAETLYDRGGPPLGLWVRGPQRLDELGRSVAIVGSRSATTAGTSVAGEIGARVARAGFTVVSGAAFGIDQAAHRGALAAGGRTVAVLACGVDRAYPEAHRVLLEHLAETSAVISELAPGRAPSRIRFLSRNRVIAALSRGTVVVEAAVRSGALSTAGWAGRLHRPVMGVPGPVNAAQSAGVHHLIRTGAASLVTSGDEVLEQVAASGEHLTERRRAADRPRDRLGPRDRQVLEAVPVRRPARSDAVARTAGIGLLDTEAALSRLLRAGHVDQTPQGWRLRGAERADSADSPRRTPEIPTMNP